MQRLKRLLLLCALASAFALLCPGIAGLAQVHHARADSLLFYGFEDGTDSFTAPGWLGANAGQPAQSADRATQGSYSLALPVSFTNGGWDQSGADKVINNNNPVDLTIYSAVSYDVYVPVPNVWSDIVFNNPWLQPSNIKPLQVGWNTVTFDISPTSQDFPNAGSYFSTTREFILRAIGRGATYNGLIYFDNVRFIPSTHPIVQVTAPHMDDTLSVPQGQTYSIQASVTSPPRLALRSPVLPSARPNNPVR